jgi:tripartite-type tricarboxylate transporter receptor subunit TctC
MQHTLVSHDRRAALLRLLAPAAAAALPTFARANDYPARPITLVVPFGPGGAVQALTERLGPDLRRELGQPMVNDYKGGVGGIIAGEAVARATPNGYTLLLATPSALAASPAVNSKVKYGAKDFAPVALVATTPFVLVVNAKLPVRNLTELIAHEVLQQLGGFRMTHVPYKGPGASLQDLVAGRLDCLISSPIPVKPHADAGNLRVIAVTSAERSPAMKDVPTIAEAGFPEFQMSSWYAYVAPAGTPREVVLKVNAAVRKALANPDTIAYMTGFGLTPAGASPEEFGSLLAEDVKRWREWVQRTGVQAE